jgi:hypothetical protein
VREGDHDRGKFADRRRKPEVVWAIEATLLVTAPFKKSAERHEPAYEVRISAKLASSRGRSSPSLMAASQVRRREPRCTRSRQDDLDEEREQRFADHHSPTAALTRAASNSDSPARSRRALSAACT